MQEIFVKADKKLIDLCNRLLSDIDFNNDSMEMQKLIEELNACQNDYVSLFSIDINKDYNITIDIASGSSNYYDNIVIWKNNDLSYNEVGYLECEFKIGNDIVLEKQEFDFLDKDYVIKFIYE